MKLNWKILGFAIINIVVVVAMTAIVVLSQRPGGDQGPGAGGPPPDGFRRGPGPRDGLPDITRNLNLSEEQKTQIAKINANFEASTKELHEQMRALRENEVDPFSPTFDEAGVRATAEARAKIEVELQVARAKAMSQIGAVLTADQRAQLAAHRPRFPGGPPPPEQ